MALQKILMASRVSGIVDLADAVEAAAEAGAAPGQRERAHNRWNGAAAAAASSAAAATAKAAVAKSTREHATNASRSRNAI